MLAERYAAIRFWPFWRRAAINSSGSVRPGSTDAVTSTAPARQPPRPRRRLGSAAKVVGDRLEHLVTHVGPVGQHRGHGRTADDGVELGLTKNVGFGLAEIVAAGLTVEVGRAGHWSVPCWLPLHSTAQPVPRTVTSRTIATGRHGRHGVHDAGR